MDVPFQSQKDGLLPISQTINVNTSSIAYHDYEGLALDHSERDRLDCRYW